ncbi:MAG TPA: YqaA family protein [Bacteroidales bacterium]|nr:MAG: Inner membrane protein YqaA [Bacteroidetes bacterium ADurb.Bin217]HPM12964.1 YqaA family protein [Bacteroidales bacterium]
MYEYVLLFAWCFTASSIIPLSSEPYYISLIIIKNEWILACFIAGIANTLGSITTFWLGKKAGEIGLQKLSEANVHRYKQAQHMLTKYGPVSLLASWVPFVGDILVTIAGALQFPFWQATAWISIGKFARYFAITAITLQFI